MVITKDKGFTCVAVNRKGWSFRFKGFKKYKWLMDRDELYWLRTMKRINYNSTKVWLWVRM